MKYFTFGMKKLRITQSYNGTVSHRPHWYNSKNYSDYPIDIAGNDGGRDIYYATVNMKVTAIRGIGSSSYTNTIWLVATEKCHTPIGDCTPFIALTHWNDNDPYIKDLYNGKIISAGTPICMEGTDGASANHLHLVVGNADKGNGDNLIKNSNDKWVSNGYCYRPEQIMFIDNNFTEVLDSSDIKFETKPNDDFLSPRGYLTKGDSGEKIELVDNYFSNLVKGNYFGDYTTAMVKEFQRQNGLEQDGNIGPITLAKMEEKGFKY